MCKVLIIDDEEPVRDAIKILGEWDKLGIEEILEASDGREGISLMHEKKPELVLVDMKMPEMNGIEFLQTAEKEYPDTFYIVVSGYDNYEFTRQAVKSKAIDYLLKPINCSDLNCALLKAVECIKEKNKKQRENIDRNITINMSLPTLKEKKFLAAIEGNLNKKEYEEYIRIVGPDEGKRCFTVAVLRIMNIDEVNFKCFNKDLNLLYFAVTNVVNELLSSFFGSFSIKNPKSENEIIINIIYEGDYSHEIKSLAIDAVRKSIRKLEMLFGAVCTVGIGGFCSSFKELSQSYKEAERFLESINLLEMKEKVIFYEVDNTAVLNIPVLRKKNLIENAFEGGSHEHILNIVREYIGKVVDSGYFSLRDAGKAIKELEIIMNDIALEKGVPEDALNDLENSMKSRGISYNYTRFDDFTKIIFGITDYFYFKIIKYAKLFDSFNINEIKDYIDNNYYEEIKISKFTEKYFLSREYLMKLFKKKFGCGIYEYVLKVRMQKAKELMNDPKIKIQNISQMLGYSDNNYFSKAFKKYYNMSPTDYKLSITKL